jgi:hypothetical protein
MCELILLTLRIRRRHEKVEGQKDRKRMTSKLTSAFVVLLLFAVVVITASAQTEEELAAKGFAIAERDPIVAAARFSGEPDAFYLLGFDIATGIFGDPALGALGNTAMGPGSLKFRDSLNAAGQRGFDASVKFHLSRKRTLGEVVTPIEKRTGAEREKALESVKKPAAEPESNEIRCRGGGFYFETVGSRIDSTGETALTIALHFNYTLTWVDREILPSGQVIQPHWNFNPSSCAWVQSGERGPYRPLSPDEIGEIRFEKPANAQLKETLHGSKVDTSPTAAERYPDARTIPAYLKDPNHYWSFFVVKPVNNSFVATGDKFWKPFLEVARPVDSKRPNRDNPYLTPKRPE